MLRRVAVALITATLIAASLAGCAGTEETFVVRFQPFSASLDIAAQSTLHAAAVYAKANPLAPLSVDGFHSRPDPTEFDTLPQDRVNVVTNALVDAGVERWRIEVLGTGIVDPQGVRMPTLPERSVVIKAGL
jgi:outer membrane protein OmpA-like peptidoglycan-associated protein